MSTINYVLPSKKYKQRVTIFSISAVVASLLCFYMNFNPFMFFTEFHFVRDLFVEMNPPNYSILVENASTGFSIVQTLSMAFLGTLYGGIIAIIIAFFAASNTMPYKIVRIIAQFALTLTRVVPILVVILIFVIAVGPGAFAGALALIVITVGMFGKLFAEIIEGAETGPDEAIYSVGASRFQVIRYSVFPQVLPAMLANLLYSFDVNIRAAIGLGIFGGGGIGFQLQMAKSVLHYRDVTAQVTVIIILIILGEKLSDYLRRKILGEEKLK